MFVSPHPARRESCLFLNSSRVGCRFLLLPAGEINQALEAIGEISHAENLEYSSDAQSSQPATVTQVLIDESGCVFEGSILGPLTLTLLPSSVTTSLVACFPNYSFNHCHSVEFCSLL